MVNMVVAAVIIVVDIIRKKYESVCDRIRSITKKKYLEKVDRGEQ